jgi:hypothetical protein
LAEASSLVSSDLRKSKFYPIKSDLQISGLVLLVLLVLWYFWYWYFWYFCETRVSLSGDPATEKVHSRCQIDPWGRAQFSRRLGR